MPDSVMKYAMSLQPKYKKSTTEGPYNQAWLTGNVESLDDTSLGEIDVMFGIVSETGEGHGGLGNEMTNPNKPSTTDEVGDKTEGMPSMNH
ncbi:hypothetical protein BK120_23630 [Paenibacillus sp. FSL A5-0031]|uniref:hypothetical protein n=1 Tax=Paenibacillus sp. FSL A5-0031 TaxID=1920420 RepID=UPI00096EECD3|nr:hypothetical protein [Paenibacillus sp. FSL A5-0031]OME78726.1 hypothetical protein BK120_23630 [Paenibacillus sp. FSL A5-0031]